jgi:DNA-binding MarR family transcriptional regulator
VAQRSEPRFLALHGVRLKGFAEAAAVAAAVGLDEATVEEQLDKLQAEELVVHRQGRLAGWALTPAGRTEQQQLAAADAEAAGATAVVRSAYERFLALNADVLGICTDWQVRRGAPNDHSDDAYDADVLARLDAVHEAVVPILDDLRAALDRYSLYAPRLAAALAKVRRGELEWLTKPLIDSYHTIWFELHEDLLSTLGIERSQEAS